MKRLGVIVALGGLLGVLGGVVTASPALAGGRGDGWQFISMPPTFTMDPVFCGFAIQGTQLVDKVFVKALKTADGSMAFLGTGADKTSLTANGRTITAGISGPIKFIDFLTAPLPSWPGETSLPCSRQRTRRASGCLLHSSLRAR